MSRARAVPVGYAPGINVSDQLRRALSHYVPADRLECAVADALAIAVGIAEDRYAAGRDDRRAHRPTAGTGRPRVTLEDAAGLGSEVEVWVP